MPVIIEHQLFFRNIVEAMISASQPKYYYCNVDESSLLKENFIICKILHHGNIKYILQVTNTMTIYLLLVIGETAYSKYIYTVFTY